MLDFGSLKWTVVGVFIRQKLVNNSKGGAFISVCVTASQHTAVCAILEVDRIASQKRPSCFAKPDLDSESFSTATSK